MPRVNPCKLVLISPNLVLSRKDPFTTGVVYMPVGLATLAAVLDERGYEVDVIDAFGERPNEGRFEGELFIRGLYPEEVVGRISVDAAVVFIYASNLTYHTSTIALMRAVKAQYPAAVLVVVENTQAVTSYSLRNIQGEFYEAGADYIITGESELRAVELLAAIVDGSGPKPVEIDGIGFMREGQIHYSPPERIIDNLSGLPFPLWEKFPLENYWRLKYSHGPMTSGKYLPLQTSRGCPYKCRFCVVPQNNSQRWRPRAAMNVVDEMQHMCEKFGVSEFHIEDLNPTINEERIVALCEEIIARGLILDWKLCAGTKAETIKSASTLALMARAGCTYISISPESGSSRLMKLIQKPFDINHAIWLIRECRRLGISTQTCFILGFPGETPADREETLLMVKKLTAEGVDEIAVFIVTPVPGSDIYAEFSGYAAYSELHFSPSWRQDYATLNSFRLRLYRNFLFGRLLRYPFSILRQALNFFTRRFRTKMEMVPYRGLHTFYLMKKISHGRQK